MPCWPDVWNRLLAMRWLCVACLVLVVILLLMWAPGVRWRWPRIVLRVLGGAALLCALLVVGLGVAMNAGDPRPEYLTVISPNGSHQAHLTYHAGFLGRDYSVVQVTKNGCCQHFTAYEYAGPSDLKGTDMVWLDDTHLKLEYRADSEHRQRCERQAADVQIVCSAIERDTIDKK
jgi:hypothetical protein